MDYPGLRMAKRTSLDSSCNRKDSPRSESVRLATVRFGDEEVHVSEFEDLEKGARPDVFCPGCGKKVVLKLGDILAHHAAHPPDSTCGFINETALHFQLKWHIADELKRAIRDAQPLLVQERCADFGDDLLIDRIRDDNQRCGVRNSHELSWEWDDIRVEGLLDGCRPDVLLRLRGAPVAAIEIFKSHAVSSEKASQFSKLGIPWLEVRADQRLLSSYSPWTIKSVLPVYRQGGRAPWRCSRHDVASKPPQPVINKTTHVEYARLVDTYAHDGSLRRTIWKVRQTLSSGVLVALKLFIDDDLIVDEILADAKELAELRKRFSSAYGAERGRLRKAFAHVDSPMEWLDSAKARECELYLASERAFPHRYVWVEKRAAWWLPSDLKQIVWGVKVDAFGYHPVIAARNKALWMRRMGITPKALVDLPDEPQLFEVDSDAKRFTQNCRS